MSLILSSVSYAYKHGEDALKEISAEFEAGTLTCWVGPNGSGKSTLLRVCAGLITPRGQVTWNGRALSDMNRLERAREIAFLPQSIPTLYRYRVQDVVWLARHPYRVGFTLPESREDQTAVMDAMAATDVFRLRDRWFDELSGGERQRVLIAAALAQGGQLLLLDEPTTALDVHHQSAILRLLRLLANEGRTVVCATHDLTLAAALADSVALLSEGYLMAAGPADEVFQEKALRQAYGEDVVVRPHPDGHGILVLPRIDAR